MICNEVVIFLKKGDEVALCLCENDDNKESLTGFEVKVLNEHTFIKESIFQISEKTNLIISPLCLEKIAEFEIYERIDGINNLALIGKRHIFFARDFTKLTRKKTEDNIQCQFYHKNDIPWEMLKESLFGWFSESIFKGKYFRGWLWQGDGKIIVFEKKECRFFD